MTVERLRESEIRPADLMDRQHANMLIDVGRLLSRYDEFVPVNCPACDSAERQPLFDKNGMHYDRCTRCRTFYVNPRPPADVLAWFYAGSPNYAYWNDVIFPASEAARREKIFVPRADRLIEICEKYGVGTSALLEVGAGFGTFCVEIASRNRFDRVVAVEPTRDLAETCRKRGLDVIEKPIEQIDSELDGGFDVVANFEVIEHLFSPRGFIKHMARLLRPGGVMIITCPNGDGFDVETLGPASNTVDHEHLNYFNPSSLGLLLSDCGLELKESFTPGQLDAELVRNAVLAGKYDLSGQPFLRRVLIDEWDTRGADFQSYLKAAGLSSNMWLVASKV